MRLHIVEKIVLSFFIVTVLLLPVSTLDANELSTPALPETLYVVPFLNVMVPPTLSSQLFDSLIDELMTTGETQGVIIRILKQDIDAIDREWLAKQTFVTGELFDYAEDAGCCSTEISAFARAYLYRPGSVDPAGEFHVPGDAFFNHDLSTLAREQTRMANRMAGELTAQIYAGLAPVQ